MASLLNKLVVSLMGQNALYLAEWPLSCSHHNELLQFLAGACLEHFQQGVGGGTGARERTQTKEEAALPTRAGQVYLQWVSGACLRGTFLTSTICSYCIKKSKGSETVNVAANSRQCHTGRKENAGSDPRNNTSVPRREHAPIDP